MSSFSYLQIIVYIARWTSVISEEVCDMGSYTTLAVQIALCKSVISLRKITYHTAKIFHGFMLILDKTSTNNRQIGQLLWYKEYITRGLV